MFARREGGGRKLIYDVVLSILSEGGSRRLRLVLAGVGDWNKSQQLQLPPKKREHLSPHVTKTKEGDPSLSSCCLLHLILAGVGE
eukprot:scaffold27175_cov58-Skeletonema_dohrnii-CCMP3373.AAC.1